MSLFLAQGKLTPRPWSHPLTHQPHSPPSSLSCTFSLCSSFIILFHSTQISLLPQTPLPLLHYIMPSSLGHSCSLHTLSSLFLCNVASLPVASGTTFRDPQDPGHTNSNAHLRLSTTYTMANTLTLTTISGKLAGHWVFFK